MHPILRAMAIYGDFASADGGWPHLQMSMDLPPDLADAAAELLRASRDADPADAAMTTIETVAAGDGMVRLTMRTG